MLPSQNLFEWYHYLLPVNTHTVSHVLVLSPWLVSKSPRLQNAWCRVRRNIILAVDLVVDILCTVSVYVRSLLVNMWILVISCRYYFFFISADNPDMLNLYFSYCMFCFQQWNFQLPTRNSGNDKLNIPSPVGLPISLTTNVFDGARVPHFVG